MQVDVLAATEMTTAPLAEAYGFNVWGNGSVTGADALAESGGRICYKSFNRPNPATAANADYLANILRQQHYSVLEHASVTFLVRDVSRALLTELERHRFLSFSVVSQRYVDYSDTTPVIPPAIKSTDFPEGLVREAYDHAAYVYASLVDNLLMSGLSRKQAREAARAVLPNCAPVDMVVTGNLRAWRDVVGKRHHEAADAEIREFAGLVLDHLREVAPNSVQDIPKEPMS
jgi:thymidylate synthase (FAD)